MRDRAYRRHIEEVIVKRRTKGYIRNYNYWRFRDINDVEYKHNFKWMAYIGSETAHMFKTHTTKRYDTEGKSKYSGPNWDSSKVNTRLGDKRELYVELKEYNIEFKNSKIDDSELF